MRVRYLALFALTLFLPACGSDTISTTPPPDPTEGLKELAEVYKYIATQRAPAPARVEDLNEHQAALGNAWQLIQDGTIVVVWKSSFSSGSNDPLAYEKSAPTNGGKVLLRNGTVKQMTADEFKAVKK